MDLIGARCRAFYPDVAVTITKSSDELDLYLGGGSHVIVLVFRRPGERGSAWVPLLLSLASPYTFETPELHPSGLS